MYVKKILVLIFCLFMFNIVNAEEKIMFDDVDEDGNGYISKMEANDNTDIKENWMEADSDKDGQIDISEFSAFEGRNMFQPPDLEEPEPGAGPSD